MNAILTVIKREYLTRVKTKGFIISTLIIPVFILAITTIPTLMALKKTENVRHILVADQSGNIYHQLENVFSDTNKVGEQIYQFKNVQVEHDLEQQKEALLAQIENDEADGVLILPEDIVQSNQMEYYAKSVTDFTFLGRLEGGMTQIVTESRLSAEGLDPQKVKELTRRLDMDTFKVETGGEVQKDEGFSFFISYILVFTLYMVVLLYGQQIMHSVIEEKTSRVIEVVISSVRPFHLMLGKIIGICSVGLTQFLLWIGAVVFLLTYAGAFLPIADAGLPNIPISFFLFFLLFFILGYFLYAAMYAAIGAMVNSEQEAQQLQFFVISFLILGIVMMMPIIKAPDSSLAVVLSTIPFISPITMFLRITVQMPPISQLALSIGLLVVTIIATVWVVSRIYRIGILMYGKRPNLPEVMKWIRYR